MIDRGGLMDSVSCVRDWAQVFHNRAVPSRLYLPGNPVLPSYLATGPNDIIDLLSQRTELPRLNITRHLCLPPSSLPTSCSLIKYLSNLRAHNKGTKFFIKRES